MPDISTAQKQTAYLIRILLSEMPEYRADARMFADDAVSQRRLLRSLMNVRPPIPLKKEFLTVQDALLTAERKEKGIADIQTFPPCSANNLLFLWQGDITRLNADAIVNAANSALLGCFYPCHGCIDNAIHSAAGLQLRDECNTIMKKQGHEEETGKAKITGAYNLAAKYVIHTVGPVITAADSFGRPLITEQDRNRLASCYRSCLETAASHRGADGKPDIHSIAFCCISTGEFHFPNQEAAETAVHTVAEFLADTGSKMKIIFNVFKDTDYAIYTKLFL